jgi:hypothetical protein
MDNNENSLLFLLTLIRRESYKFLILLSLSGSHILEISIEKPKKFPNKFQ